MRQLYLTRFGSIITKTFGAPSISDISYGLAGIFRYNGCSEIPISVAVHSLLCYEIAKEFSPEDLTVHLIALLHDAAECVTGDHPSPFKTQSSEDLENNIQLRIFVNLGLFDFVGADGFSDFYNELYFETVRKYDRYSFLLEISVLGMGGLGAYELYKEYVIEDDLLKRTTNAWESMRKRLREHPSTEIDYWAREYGNKLRELLVQYHEME